ncbi:MAG: hypothetical protein JSW55_11400, partial [Chloroflexota bacterium]
MTSIETGSAGAIALQTAPEGDALEIILGIRPSAFTGAAAEPARLVGQKDLSTGVNLFARHLLRIAIDGKAPQEIDLRSRLADPGQVSLEKLADAINTELAGTYASGDDDNLHLML